MKKSYNPFKMVLPYIGVVIILLTNIIYSFVVLKNGFGTPLGFALAIPLYPISWLYNLTLNSVILSGLVLIVYGFLIGWGIQSLWRAFKK